MKFTVADGKMIGGQYGLYAFGYNFVNVYGGTIQGKTKYAVYASNNNTITISGGTLIPGGTAAALGIGGGSCTVTVGREGGVVGDVTIPSIDFKPSYSANKATVNLLSGTVEKFKDFANMKVEKVAQGKDRLLVGTDITANLPDTDLVCQKVGASGLYEIVELTVENAVAVITRNGEPIPCRTVGQAVTALSDGDTLTLKEDYTGALVITKKNVIVDLGGKTLTYTGATGGLSSALSFSQSAASDNTVTVKNGTIVAKAQDAACVRAEMTGDLSQTLTVVFGENLTLTSGNTSRYGGVVLGKGARTEFPCEKMTKGGLLVVEDDGKWIYGESETAFTHANGSEVTLLNDWYCTDSEGAVKVPSSGTFASAKLNLNEHTISFYPGGENPAIVMGAVGEYEDEVAKTLEILNGTIKTSRHGAAVCGSNKSLTLDGVKLTTTGDKMYGLFTNGTTTENTVTLKSGSAVTSETGYGIYFPGNGTLTIENSNVTGGVSGIEVRAGTLNVSGTSVIKSTAAEFSFANNANGPTTTGAAVAAVKHTVGNDLTVNISGGTFEGIKGFYEYDPNADKAGTVTIAISGGMFSTAIDEKYCAEGFVPTVNEDGTYSVKQVAYVAQVGTEKYETLQAAIDAAGSGKTVTLIADTKENVTIAKKLTLDLNGYTLNGGTEKGKAALSITARVTVKDSSEAQTGTIKREDTATNSGETSYYVMDVQGDAWVTFEGGKVINDSGTTDGTRKGTSLVRIGDDSVSKYPGLTIKGGTFTQNNFVAIKVDRGDLFVNDGTINCANDEAIKNWLRTTIKGGTVNGTVSSWVYGSGAKTSTLTITGGTVNGDVYAMTYDGAEDKTAKVSVTGGMITGELGTYQGKDIHDKTPLDDTTKATIAVTGGMFVKDPTAYLAESATVSVNGDKYAVEKAYLAKVGETSYYTMDEAFTAQTASGGAIVLLRDYTIYKIFYSGSINRTVDLNGYTWTYTGTDTDSAAFEINYSDVTLTVKNGKVVSNSMLGLIPSVSSMTGPIYYDNAGLVFENVVATANGHSGIETNGGNTDDAVTLKDSTLNVPNGYGIYFPSSGALTIENSTINAKTMGVQVCSGSLNISEGSVITVTGDAVPKTENDGAIEDGAAVSVVNRPGYKGLGTVVISGGTFTAKSGNEAVKAYTWENKAESAFDNANGTVAISGGTFSTAIDEKFCALGYIPTKNADETYGVKKGAYVAAIGETKYETVADAIAAANDGDTVKLLTDATQEGAQLVIPADKKLTLDLNGQTLKVSKYTTAKAQVSVFGELTVTDSSVDQSGMICSDYTGTSGLVVQVEKGGKMVMEGGTITTEGMANAGNAVKVASGGTVEMTGGTIRCDAKRANRAINVSGNFTMTGGSVVADEGDGSESSIYAVFGNYSSVVAISGASEVSGPEAVNVSSANTTITGGRFTGKITVKKGVSGGTFDQEVPMTSCVAYYESAENDDGTYGIVPFTSVDVRISEELPDTISVRMSRGLLDSVEGTTNEEKKEKLSQPDANGNLVWVNLVTGLASDAKVRAVDVVQGKSTSAKSVFIAAPVDVGLSANSDAKVTYSIDKIDTNGNILVKGAEVSSGSLAIALSDIESSARYRVNVFVRSADGTDVATLVSENEVGVLKTTTSAKKAIIAVPWLSLADGGNITVANLVKTANLTKGDKLHVFNASEKKYDVYELTANKTWEAKAVYQVDANGQVSTTSSGESGSTTIARGCGVWLERQNTDLPIVSYGQVPAKTVETTIAAGTAEAPTWNLLAAPTTEAFDLSNFDTDDVTNDKIIVPTEGAPRVYTYKDSAWGYAKTVEVTDRWGKTSGVKVVRETATELPAGTGFWYLNGGSEKTVNW